MAADNARLGARRAAHRTWAAGRVRQMHFGRCNRTKISPQSVENLIEWFQPGLHLQRGRRRELRLTIDSGWSGRLGNRQFCTVIICGRDVARGYNNGCTAAYMYVSGIYITLAAKFLVKSPRNKALHKLEVS